jgi:hypothetical protein
LSINATCVGTPTWKKKKKTLSFNIARSFRGKAGSSHLIWGVM